MEYIYIYILEEEILFLTLDLLETEVSVDKKLSPESENSSNGEKKYI